MMKIFALTLIFLILFISLGCITNAHTRPSNHVDPKQRAKHILSSLEERSENVNSAYNNPGARSSYNTTNFIIEAIKLQKGINNNQKGDNFKNFSENLSSTALSNVTIRSVPKAESIRYNRVESNEVIDVKDGTHSLRIGVYNIWAENNNTPTTPRYAEYDIVKNKHTITLKY